MTASAGIVLGVGVGVLIVAPLIVTFAVLGADALFDWHQRRVGRG